MRIQPEYLLRDFRAYLEDQLGNRNTANRYYYAVCRFFRENEIEDLHDVTSELVLEGLAAERGRNRTSALKLGLAQLQAYFPALELPDSEDVHNILAGKRDRSVRSAKTIYLEEVQSKVMRLRNQKLKLAFRLMMCSGLRVSECAALEREDITVAEDGRIEVHVRHGKGGSNGVVRCLPDAYLEKHLPEYLSKLPDGENPFYAAITMKKAALKHGMECHDFRRIAAIQHRKQQMEQRRQATLEVPTVQEIDEKTKDFLRHERFSTTKRYLYNRKLKIKLPETEGDET